VGALKYL